MASSDRFEPSRDRSAETQRRGARRPKVSGHRNAQSAPVERTQYFDPGEPWDADAAEALTRLYESGEAYADRADKRTDAAPPGKAEKERTSRQPRLPPQPGIPSPQPLEAAWLEARLADIARRLQDTLAGLNPHKAIEPLTRRLDSIEQNFNAALSQVAKRSDLDGLRLIEANVMELAAHVEQTRGRLDRLDAIDENVHGLARRLDEADSRQLSALEKLLQDYMTEWRRGGDRTASALQSLEDRVNRIGESVDVMEAYKPASDQSLSAFGTERYDSSGDADRDPLSQVYADTAQTLDHHAYGAPLHAADYTLPAGTRPGASHAAPPLLVPAQSSAHYHHRDDVASNRLAPPALRASAVRAQHRQAEVLGAEISADGDGTVLPRSPAGGASLKAAPAPQRGVRPGLLLAAGVTLLAAGGYLLVDVLMAPKPVHQGTKTAHPPIARASGADLETPVVSPHASKDGNGAPDRVASDQAGDAAVSAATKTGRVEAIGNSIAAIFRAKAPAAPVETTASIAKDPPPVSDEVPRFPSLSLPMNIGPASLRQAAMRGEAAAQFEIANRFASGAAIPRDMLQAFQWYSRAAAQGLVLAQYRLAALYERGMGTAADPERARAWYVRAAEQGNVKAMHNLAVMSVSGGRTDYATAAKWFAQAADLGLADSQFNLAVLHQSGLGAAKDARLTYKWLALAARSGDREAVSRLADLKSRLSASDLQEAEALVAAWRPRRPDPAVNELAMDAVSTAQ